MDDSRPGSPIDYERAADGYNAGYAEDLYERRVRDNGLIPPSLAPWSPSPVPALPAVSGIIPSVTKVVAVEDLQLAAISGALVEAYRAYGHLAASIDPLGSIPPHHPMLTPDFYGVQREDLARVPSSAVQLEHLGDTVVEVLDRLENIYCGRIGYEIDQVEDPDQREWLAGYIESSRHTQPLHPERAYRVLERLTRVEGLERFLHRSYIGKKRFSIEGLDMLLPMLREILVGAGQRGTRSVFIGMAHRGRLNVLAHVIGLSYESIVAEFEEQMSRGIQPILPELGSGDVKYHVGGQAHVADEDVELDVRLAPNPSHLEHVNPVVLGMARAERFLSKSQDPSVVLPILIHGDASFAGQGIVAETLNLCRLKAYETGGTLHIVANNQLGFTTIPKDSRSTRYASDLALGFRIPIVHVNADDPAACLAAAQLAVDYRSEFGQDLVIDLVGYRRHGHNEADEPGYTQPLLYDQISEHPSVRKQYATALVADGILTQSTADAMADEVHTQLSEARESIGAEKERKNKSGHPANLKWLTEPKNASLVTAVPEAQLRKFNNGINSCPEPFSLFHKLARQRQQQHDIFNNGIDWAHGEALAFASLLADGIPIRFTGEDTERGTFSHRHLVLHEPTTGETYTPIAHLDSNQATFEIANSPLSEIATLGFEYGFSTVAADALVIWEAQFGDFVNVAQPIIDQFIVAGRSKWGQESRLVLLLPHGYEGQGPEHSSARLERFLQLAAESNIRIANCTTPAQYFHLLRWQALRETRRPLIMLTPKSLLRKTKTYSNIRELTTGSFQSVIQDPEAVAAGSKVDRVILCSGKVYYDLLAEAPTDGNISILRLDLLYPFPKEELSEALSAYPNSAEVCWVQEEPKNMGAWNFIRSPLRETSGREPLYIGRIARASPAEGFARRYASRQKEIVGAALRLE